MNQNIQEYNYATDHGNINLSPSVVRKYLVSGDKTRITDQEIMVFIALCKYQKLNPFLREAYLIKFGAEDATIVVGKEVFTKRANKNPECDGWQAGIILQGKEKLERREGTLVLPNEKLLGGWAKVYRKTWQYPLTIEVSFDEYARKRKDGQLMKNWKSMPATMIRKVAIVQALRDAFPEDLQGLYSAEEMPIDNSQLSQTAVTLEEKDITKETNIIEEIDDETKAKGLCEAEGWEQLINKAANLAELENIRFPAFKNKALESRLIGMKDIRKEELKSVKPLSPIIQPEEITPKPNSLNHPDDPRDWENS